MCHTDALFLLARFRDSPQGRTPSAKLHPGLLTVISPPSTNNERYESRLGRLIEIVGILARPPGLSGPSSAATRTTDAPARSHFLIRHVFSRPHRKASVKNAVLRMWPDSLFFQRRRGLRAPFVSRVQDYFASPPRRSLGNRRGRSRFPLIRCAYRSLRDLALCQNRSGFGTVSPWLQCRRSR